MEKLDSRQTRTLDSGVRLGWELSCSDVSIVSCDLQLCCRRFNSRFEIARWRFDLDPNIRYCDRSGGVLEEMYFLASDWILLDWTSDLLHRIYSRSSSSP